MRDDDPAVSDPDIPEDPFPIVGIGASAGGLEAVSALLAALPEETGAGYVVIQHLSPTHESHLADLLGGKTELPVIQAEDGMRVQPNHIYVIPPESSMDLDGDRLRLHPRKPPEEHENVIDRFFRSLARERGDRAIGVILSGTLSDGVQGLREIKAAGGFTFAQDQATAVSPQMPFNAVAAGHVDFVLPPDQIADELSRLSSDPGFRDADHLEREAGPEMGEARLQKVFGTLRKETGHDFSRYKRSTVQRRINRRMMANHCETLEAYVDKLEEDPEEARELFEALLITVTRFFRDEGISTALEERILPGLLETRDRDRDDPVRVWVPACATGEEAYSLAMLLAEQMEAEGVQIPVRIFATDLNQRSIDIAREGHYPDGITDDVSPERLQRFFVEEQSGYRVSETLRSMCVFAVQDLPNDPPFSDIDLISCRNLLIYLQPELQERALSRLHYALRPSGILVVGPSEDLGPGKRLFERIDDQTPIFRKRDDLPTPPLDPIATPTRIPDDQGPEARAPGQTTAPTMDLGELADEIALETYAPPGLLVNDQLEILEFRGDTSLYLDPTSGQASLELMKVVPQGLALAIRDAIKEATEEKVPIHHRDVEFSTRDGQARTDVRAIPIEGPGRPPGTFLVFFEDTADVQGASDRDRNQGPGLFARLFGTQQEGLSEDARRRIAGLEDQLEATRDYLESVTEAYEATNEELRSANEEALSSNEELQSTNEELETAKEELQSTNQELTTLNEELQERNEELQRVNNDLVNLLNTTDLPIVMVDASLQLRRWTPPAEELLNLIPTDLGRPITNLQPTVEIDALDKRIQEVLEDPSVRTHEVEDEQGATYQLEIHPYRTTENEVDGAVLVFLSRGVDPDPP